MPVVSYVPLMMFAILFGLSMDYQVFLVSRITERHQGGADNSEAVRAGLVNAGRVIAAAATIMFAVFFSFVINGDPVVKQFGIGLAVAVAIDALVVLLIMPGAAGADRRAELVPAALARSGAARPEGRGRPRDGGRDAHRPGLRLSHRKRVAPRLRLRGPSHLSSPSPGA